MTLKATDLREGEFMREEKSDTSRPKESNTKSGDLVEKIGTTRRDESALVPDKQMIYNENLEAYTEKEVGGYDPSEKIGSKEINVGDPQIKVKKKERSVTSILRELAAIQQQGPQKYCILGTRHCSFLHQQIIELL